MRLCSVTRQIAQSFYEKYEHLGNCGLGVWHFGLFEDDILLSVVSFGTTSFNPKRSALGQVAQKYNMRIVQLTRGGTRYDAATNTPSKAIALAIKEMRRMLGNIMIVAYSDIKWNEIGTIYQASNFLYLGTTNPKGQANYYYGDKALTGWSVRKKYGTRDMEKLSQIIPGIRKDELTRKHIYLYVCANQSQKANVITEISNMLHPYPKRSELKIGSMHDMRKTIKSCT